jgi:RNA polymerase sigma factor (sigma-70 family)
MTEPPTGRDDDAVQEAWLRMDRTDIGDVGNLRGWLTTVVARSSRPELPLDKTVTGQTVTPDAVDPEHEAELADSIGAGLLVVLQTLSPAERLAFVLHDMFDLPFSEIAPIVGRSENTATQLAARARRRC